MKKILGLTVAAMLVMGLVGGGTWAFFSDPESSTGNTLSAGTLDLQLDGGDAAVTTLNIATAYPGDSGSGSTTLLNYGSLAAELDISFGSVTNTESVGDSEYESDVIGGGGNGELGSQATFAFFVDVDTSGGWSTGDIGLSANSTGVVYAHPAALEYQALDDYGTDVFDDVYTGTMAPAASDDFIIMYQVPTSADNTIQGDSLSMDVSFTLEQTAVD